MPRTKISEFSSTPASNTDIDSINIAENCPPSGINDAIRELMAQLKDFQTGAVGDSFNGPVGTTTAAAGAFTTLAASSTVTLSGGTANGVAYLNGSKVVTSGSALTFDGTNLGVGTTSPAAKLGVAGNIFISGASSYIAFDATQSGSTPAFIQYASNSLVFGAGSSEQMRLTSTGLGIGTSSPAQKLHVENNANSSTWIKVANTNSGSGAAAGVLFANNGGDLGAISLLSSANSPANSLFLRSLSTNTLTLGTNNTVQATLDSSGNLGLGVTPSAWSYRSLSVGTAGTAIWQTGSDFGLASNAYNNGGWKYNTTGGASLYDLAGNQHIWYNAPSGTAGNAITFTQAMTLDASGRLLVGVTSPSSSTLNFEVGATAPIARINATGGGTPTLSLFSSGVFDWTIQGGTALKFSVDGSEKSRIDSSGNLLVGTTTSGGSGSGVQLYNFSGTVGASIFKKTASGTFDAAAFFHNNSSVGSISYSNTATAYNTSSDYRLKNITGALTGYKERLMSLQPKQGTWITDGSEFRGFLAHEFAEPYRASVTGEKDAVDAEGKPIYQGMQASSSEVMADLVAMVNELITENASLKARLDAANL